MGSLDEFAEEQEVGDDSRPFENMLTEDSEGAPIDFEALYE